MDWGPLCREMITGGKLWERDCYIPAQILKAQKNLTNDLPSMFLKKKKNA